MDESSNLKPSKAFCDTGTLDTGEKYNPSIHNSGTNPKDRCENYYEEYKNARGGGASAKENLAASRNPNAEMDANRENIKYYLLLFRSNK
jgi:hypothetical protein